MSRRNSENLENLERVENVENAENVENSEHSDIVKANPEDGRETAIGQKPRPESATPGRNNTRTSKLSSRQTSFKIVN